ncbi:MAG: hypothetical protein ABFD69_03195 [Candidatus Sumerlaeia bacterium]
MPTPSQVHIDAALTNLSVGYRNPAFIADVLAPVVPVRKQSDKYFIYDSERAQFRPSDDKRAPGTEASEIGFDISSDSYYCEDHALASVIADEERENADPAIQPAIDRTEFLRAKIDLNKEIELAAMLTSTSVITQSTTLSGDAQWSDPDSDPVAEVEARKATIMGAVQVLPNTLVLPYPVYASVRVHDAVRACMGANYTGAITEQMLAQIFDVENVLVARSFKNTAAAGQTPSMSYVWGKDALLAYVPTRPGLKQMALALTFAWAGAPGSVSGHIVEMWREDRRKADAIRVQRYYDQKLIAAGAAFLWKSAVA